MKYQIDKIRFFSITQSIFELGSWLSTQNACLDEPETHASGHQNIPMFRYRGPTFFDSTTQKNQLKIHKYQCNRPNLNFSTQEVESHID